MKMFVRAATMAALALGLSGCALTEDQISLSYLPPKSPVTAVANAQAVTVTVTGADERTLNADRVSVKKNGYGMEMAAIRSTVAPAELVRAALEQEIKARGFAIGGGGVTVSMRLQRFYNDFKIGAFSGDAAADVAFNVEVRSATGQIVYTRAIQVQGLVTGIMLADGSNAKQALELGLTNAMEHMRADTAFWNAIISAGAPKATGKPTS